MEAHRFYVGQAVVYVNDANQIPLLPGECRPKLHRIYTIRALVAGILPGGIRHPALLLNEVVNPAGHPLRAFEELCFRQERFAPVELLPAEALAELKELLEPVPA